jgi:tRNA (guanosine-2'-O-)-methyltransferase
VVVTPERLAKIRSVLDKRQPDLTVLMERVHKPHNFSAILRSCDAVGVLEAHAIPARYGIPELADDGPALSKLSLRGKTFNETSGSASKWVGLRVHDQTLTALAHLKAQGFQVLAAHFSERAVDYRQVDYTRPACILLGTEKWGVSPEAAERSDAHILIPMMGMVQSLNVSVAAAVILFEAQRQRLQAGLYDQPRLPPGLYEEVLENWLLRHARGGH